MKIKLLLLLTILSNILFADELQLAYQKEYAYLIAEKKALSQRIKQVDVSQESTLTQVKQDIKKLQIKSLSYQNKIDLLNQQIVEASRGAQDVDNDSIMLDATILQAKETLKKVDLPLNENIKKELTIADAIKKANQVLIDDEKVTKTKGEFYLSDGRAVNGDIIKIGRVAQYGISSNNGGLLAPAGNGSFRVWEKEGISIAQDIQNGKQLDSIDIFLYENTTKALEKQEEKGFNDDLKAGGITGYVILILGALGLFLAILRMVFLTLSSSNTQKIKDKITPKLKENNKQEALAICATNNSSASRVMAATIRNLDKDREHIEDIISESVLHESSKLDRFGSFILVIAAISPLLGLLGTVTGMISTFDIITEFGTGDPKMLSSGISEALITTKFGLVVAIPLLVLGNVLSSWAEKIKDTMEQSALHIINKNKK